MSSFIIYYNIILNFSKRKKDQRVLTCWPFSWHRVTIVSDAREIWR